METETWIERAIVQELSYPDKRYKHGYKAKEASTVELIVVCASMKEVTEELDFETWEQVNRLEEQMEGPVEDTVKRMQEQELLTEVGKQPLYQDDLFTRLAE